MLSSLLFAAPASAQVANPKARHTVAAEAEVVYQYLNDIGHFSRVMSPQCVSDWDDLGVGVWHFGLLHPRLKSVIDKSYPSTTVDILNEGERSFTVRFSLLPVDGKTQVALEAYLSPPPWPLVSYYEKRVRPKIVSCLGDSLRRLERQLLSEDSKAH